MDLEASNAIMEKQDKTSEKHQMDKNYESLNTDMVAIDEKEESYQLWKSTSTITRQK